MRFSISIITDVGVFFKVPIRSSTPAASEAQALQHSKSKKAQIELVKGSRVVRLGPETLELVLTEFRPVTSWCC